MRWDFFVRHYADEAQQRAGPEIPRDVRRRERVDGVLYPRAGTLGGCTAHNAMILVYPHNADWNQLADLTGDPSGAPRTMRALLRADRTLRAPARRAARSRFGSNPSRHGWSGWLQTEFAVPPAVVHDTDMRRVLRDSALDILQQVGGPAGDRARIESQDGDDEGRLRLLQVEGRRCGLDPA